MNALLYATQYPVPLSLHIPGEHSNGPPSTNSSETDPILEDTPDTLDDDVDYTTVPPEIGQTILIDECGREISLGLPPPRAETPFILSPQERLSIENDCDDYPFHAVTYGETGDCHGLPYNDHNYALNDTNSKSIVPEDDGHLSLLAKLALAKDEKPSDVFIDSTVHRNPSVASGLVVSIDAPNNMDNHFTKRNCRKEVLNKNNFVHSSGSGNQLLITNTLQRLLPRAQSSKPIPSHWSSPSGNRAVILPSTQNTGKSPLQVHRISSSLTPQIVLRTSAPALHINTTASQFPIPDSVESGIIRCIPTCTRQDGCLMQCDKCKVWQHADCVSSAETSLKTSPHLCERCTTFPIQFTSAPLAIHRSPPALSNKLASPPVTPVPGIRISRASPLNPTVTSAPGRIFVTTSAACSLPTTRQLHICLSNSPSFSATLGNRPDVSPAEAALSEAQYVVTRITPCGVTLNQPVRSSKRKQDLITLSTGSTFNTGLDGISGTVSTVDTPSTVPTMTGGNSVNVDGLTLAEEVRQQQVPTTRWQPKPVSNTGGISGSNSGGSLHRLLVQLSDRSSLEAGHLTTAPASTSDTHDYDQQHRQAASPCSTVSSDSIESHQSLDTYEEAVDLRLSDRLYRRLLEGILPSGSPVRQGLEGPEQPLANKFAGGQRCKLVTFDFNHKVLVASEDLYPREPIMEYRGTCMLRSEYTEVYDCRKHYNPFVLFYDTSNVALCIDARKYGNEARYLRRSCTPNCEVKHSFSMDSASQSGEMPCMQFFIVATKQIQKMSELTIAFDFDYTVCRYLVTCACGRKACPVSRWFRHGGGGQFGTVTAHRRTSLHESNSNSLIYSRKLVTSIRGTGATTLRSRLSAAHHSVSGSLNLHTLESVNGDTGTRPLEEHAWNHLRYRRGSGRPRNFPLSASSKKSINARRRGRGRGRGRAGSHFYSVSRTTTTAALAPARVSRGRPSKKSSALLPSESPYPRTGRAAQSCRHTAGHRVSSSHSNDALLGSSDKVASDHKLSNSEEEGEGEAMTSIDNQPEGHRHNRDTINRASRFNRHSRSTDEREDVDTETDPEREDDQSQILTVHQEVLQSPPSIAVKCEKSMATASKTHSKHVKRVSDDNLSKQDASADGHKGSKTGSSIRTQRHHHIVADSSSSKKTHVSSKDQPKRESREDMWMAEVLRRIERLEKKQSKQRTENAHDSSVKAKRTMDMLEDQPSSSAKSHDNEVKPKPCFDFYSTSGRAAATEHDAVGDTRSPTKPEVLDTADAVNFWSSNKSPLTIKDTENLEVSDTLSEFSPTSVKLVPCRSNRRRRLQPPAPPDAPTSRAIDEKRDSREERWLKSQLRRIAELETHDAIAPRQTLSSSASNKQTDFDASMLSPSKESHVDIHQDGNDSLHDAPVCGISQYNTITSPDKTDCTEKTSPLSAVKTSDVSWDVSVSSVGRTDANSHQAAIDLEADCGLIVYRVREKDPMAKFSRRPSVCLLDDNTTQNSQEDGDQLRCVEEESEHYVCHSQNFHHASSRPTCGSFSVHRPTKKRWLSQALLEGDRETLSNGLTASLDNSFDRCADKDVARDGQSLGVNTATNMPTSVTGPVNPKKRLLSQFSNTVDGSDPLLPMSADPLLYCQEPKQDAISADCFAGTVRCSKVASTCTTTGDAPTDSASQPTTPLPPKKATVKQQAEQLRLQEMRKTRVSLSEYRRRKGLSSLPHKSIALNKDIKQSESHGVSSPKVTDAYELDIVVPEELGSSDLLLQLPNARHLPQFLAAESCLTPSKPDGNDYRKSPGISQPSSAHFLAGESTLSQFKVRLDEGGPRTPSEPPDDEDSEQLRKSVPPTLTLLQQAPLEPVKSCQPSFVDSNNRTLNEALSWSSSSEIGGKSPNVNYSRLNDTRPLQAPSASKVAVMTADDMATRRQSHPSSITSSQSKSFVRQRFPSSGTHVTVCSNPSSSESSSSREPGKSQAVCRDCTTGCNTVPVPVAPDDYRLPPPPPPARPLFTAAQTSSNCLTRTGPTEVDDGSVQSRPNSLSSSHSRLNPVDYFIRRDQEIRMWQEARSYEWDRRQTTPHRHQTVGQIDHHQQRHGQHHRTRGRLHRGQQMGHFAYDSRQIEGSSEAKVPRTDIQPKSSVPSDCHRLDDVEQTLFRLHDSLRIQLDQTRQALTHTPNPRHPVNGDAVVVPYRHDELTRLRRVGTGDGGYGGRSRKRLASPPTS